MIFCARVQRQDRHYCNEHWIKKLLFVEKLVNIVRKAEDERKINMKYIINAKIVSSHVIYERRQYSILSLSLFVHMCHHRTVRGRSYTAQVFVYICARLNVRHLQWKNSVFSLIRATNLNCRLHLICYCLFLRMKTNQWYDTSCLALKVIFIRLNEQRMRIVWSRSFDVESEHHRTDVNVSKKEEDT